MPSGPIAQPTRRAFLSNAHTILDPSTNPIHITRNPTRPRRFVIWIPLNAPRILLLLTSGCFAEASIPLTSIIFYFLLSTTVISTVHLPVFAFRRQSTVQTGSRQVNAAPFPRVRGTRPAIPGVLGHQREPPVFPRFLAAQTMP